MKNEIIKRIITSLILILLLFLMLKYTYILISSFLIILTLSGIEFKKILDNIFSDSRKLFFKIFFQLFFFSYLVFFFKIILDDYLYNKPDISWNIIFVITICILSDIGGYIFGKIFGGKKLTKISPGKTYAGACGSLALSILFAIFYSYTLNFVDLTSILIIAISISIICQLGDIFISYLKRLAKQKDTGNLLPGHGGILDRIDGILFALPFGIILINFLY